MIQSDKKSLRKEVRARKKQFSTEELINGSRPLIQRVLNHPRLQSAKTVLLYNSLPDEVYTHDLIKQLHNERKELFFFLLSSAIPKWNFDSIVIQIPLKRVVMEYLSL